MNMFCNMGVNVGTVVSLVCFMLGIYANNFEFIRRLLLKLKTKFSNKFDVEV